MVSHTYFSLRTEEMMMQKENTIETGSWKRDLEETQNEYLCYICESNVSNTILTKCGHGGVCCECAIRSIEQKNECMGCRKLVKALYKTESSSRHEAEIIVQSLWNHSNYWKLFRRNSLTVENKMNFPRRIFGGWYCLSD